MQGVACVALGAEVGTFVGSGDGGVDLVAVHAWDCRGGVVEDESWVCGDWCGCIGGVFWLEEAFF